MTMKILTTYATTHGATAEVAEVIVSVLREAGHRVDLQLAREVRSLQGYDAVVLGAPLYMFRLHNDARRFLARHQTAFSGGLPIAIFAGGPFDKADEKVWQEVRTNLEQQLAKFAWLKPAAVEVIGGKFDPSSLKFPWNLIPAMRSMQPSDLRDWDAIRTWAAQLPARLFPAG